MAERIQRKRTKGWKMPENTVYVGRPSHQWGNPYVVCPDHPALANYTDYTKNVDGWDNWPVKDAETAVRAFREMRCTETFIKMAKSALRGKNLACWCKPGAPCHADVLLEIANGTRADVGNAGNP